MFSTLHCISLRSVRHSDKNTILSVWTAEAGRVSFAMPEGSGREARRRRAITMPLGLFEGECDIKPGRDILSIRDVKPSPQALGAVPDPGKTVVAMFLADVLDKVLRQPVPDGHLSLFLFDALSIFGRMSNPAAVANFHIVFLYKLMRYLGIQPDTGSWRPGAYFDMKEGRFLLTPPLHDDFLADEEVDAMRLVARLDFRSMAVARFSRDERNAILDTILHYYSAHLVRLDNLRSLQIIRSLF